MCLEPHHQLELHRRDADCCRSIVKHPHEANTTFRLSRYHTMHLRSHMLTVKDRPIARSSTQPSPLRRSSLTRCPRGKDSSRTRSTYADGSVRSFSGVRKPSCIGDVATIAMSRYELDTLNLSVPKVASRLWPQRKTLGKSNFSYFKMVCACSGD